MPWWPWALTGVLVAAWTAAVVRLPGPAVIDPDGHASAIHLDRLLAGARLEVPLLSTPKPLLTLIHGLAWQLTGDWRMLTLLTVLAFAVGVTALARAASRRLGVAAAAGVVVALAGSAPLLLQVARGNSVVWALAGWAVALDALDRPAPRWRHGGLVLLAAGLARSETWLLLPFVGLWAAWRWRRGDRQAAWLLVGLAAPLLWLAHDWVLTGDLMYSSKVPERYTDLIPGRDVVPPLEFLGEAAARYANPAVLALAAAGVAALVRRRAWLWLGGLAVCTLGLLTLLGWYSWRGVYVSWRYYDPVDTSIHVAAALGAAWLAGLAAGRRGQLVAAPLAALAAAAALWPLGPADPVLGSTLDRDTRLSANAATAIDVLAPLTREGETITVSGPQRGRVALELGVPLTRVEDLFLATLHEPLDRALATSTAVYHDADGDRPPSHFTPLSTTTPTTLGPLQLTPLHTNPRRGLYLHHTTPTP